LPDLTRWNTNRCLSDSIKCRRDLCKELVAQALLALLVPKRRAAKFSARVSEQFDAHAVRRVPSECRPALFPNRPLNTSFGDIA